MVDKKIRRVVNVLADIDNPNPLKFFEENKDDEEFLYFLKSIFERMKYVDEEARSKVVDIVGDELGWAINDTVDKAYLKVDKRVVEGILYSEDDEDFIICMRKLLKSIMKDLED